VIRGDRTALRPVTEDDLDLLAAWFADHAVYEWWGGSALSREVVADKYVGRRRPDVESLVTEVEGRPVGYVQYHQGFEPYHSAREGGIDMFIAPTERRHGLGRDAVAALVQHLIEVRGWTRVTVDPVKDNLRARAFWRACGFTHERDIDRDVPSELLSIRA